MRLDLGFLAVKRGISDVGDHSSLCLCWLQYHTLIGMLFVHAILSEQPGKKRVRWYFAGRACCKELWYAAGILIAALFIFVRPLAFIESELLGLGVAVGLLRLSPGITAGARISSCANLVFATWSIVLAAALVSCCYECTPTKGQV